MAARRFALVADPPPLDEAEVGSPCAECKGPTVLTSTLDLVEKHTRRCSRRRGVDRAQLSVITDASPAAVPGRRPDDARPDVQRPSPAPPGDAGAAGAGDPGAGQRAAGQGWRHGAGAAVHGTADDDDDELSGEPDTERVVTVLVSREEVVTGGYDVREVRIARYGQWWIVEVRNRGGAIRPGARTRDERQAKQWANDEWTSLRTMAKGSRYWEVARTR